MNGPAVVKPYTLAAICFNSMTETSSFKDYLDKCIDKYYSGVITKYNFKIVNTYFDGLGAIYEFQCNSFKLKIVNDKGIVNGDIAPLYKSDTYKEIDAYNSLIQIKQHGDLKLCKWEMKMILTKLLSCQEEAEFIDSKYQIISQLLSIDNYLLTLSEIDNLQRKRFNYPFINNKGG